MKPKFMECNEHKFKAELIPVVTSGFDRFP